MREGGLRLAFVSTSIAPTIAFPSALFHPGFYRWLESFTEESDEIGLLWCSVSIKFNKDGLKEYEVRSPILNSFLLVLRLLQMVSTKALESPRFFRRKALNSTQGKGATLALVSALVLVPAEADPSPKEQSCNWGAVGASRAGGLEMIFALLAELWYHYKWDFP